MPKKLKKGAKAYQARFIQRGAVALGCGDKSITVENAMLFLAPLLGFPTGSPSAALRSTICHSLRLRLSAKTARPTPVLQTQSECAPQNFDQKLFYASWDWKEARYSALRRYGPKCQCCGATPKNARIVVDHIKPIRLFWKLRLDQGNLQILCEDCNMGKSYKDQTDWRGKSHAR